MSLFCVSCAARWFERADLEEGRQNNTSAREHNGPAALNETLRCVDSQSSVHFVKQMSIAFGVFFSGCVAELLLVATRSLCVCRFPVLSICLRRLPFTTSLIFIAL